MSGTTSDANGDSGTFSYTLTVTGVSIDQALTAGSVSTVGSANFVSQLLPYQNTAPVLYNQTSGSANVLVSASGAISTTSTLAAGTYTVSGTTSDANGDSGTFSYTLSIVPITLGVRSMSSVVTRNASANFAIQLMAIRNVGPVVYSKIGGDINFKVSSSGKVTTSRVLVKGIHRFVIRLRDAYLDNAKFIYTVVVK